MTIANVSPFEIRLGNLRPSANKEQAVPSVLKIIAERRDGQWLIWLANVPQISFKCETPEEGIVLIVAHIGEHHFETDFLWTIEDVSSNHRLEFTLPMRKGRRIPIPSLN